MICTPKTTASRARTVTVRADDANKSSMIVRGAAAAMVAASIAVAPAAFAKLPPGFTGARPAVLTEEQVALQAKVADKLSTQAQGIGEVLRIDAPTAGLGYDATRKPLGGVAAVVAEAKK